MLARECGDHLECLVDTPRPVGCLAVVHEAIRGGRAVDHLAETHLEGRLVAICGKRGHLQPPKQDRIALNTIHDHLDERWNVLAIQVSANTREDVEAFCFRAAACRICGQRRRHQMLAIAPIAEGTARTRTVNRFASPH